MDKIIVHAKNSQGDWEKICYCEESEWEAIKFEVLETIGQNEYKIEKVCRFCGEYYDVDESICGCPESLDEVLQMGYDNAAEAKSERQRGC